MLRAAGVATAIALIAAGTAVTMTVFSVGEARADGVDDRIAEMSRGENYKLRMAGALALSKSSDGRALRALAVMLLDSGSERSLRRVAVLGLSKQLPKAPAALRAELVRVLDRAASSDDDAKIRASAASAAKAVKKVITEEDGGTARVGHPEQVGTPDGRDTPAGKVPTPGTLRSDAPKVFVNVDGAVDLTTKMTPAVLSRLTTQVKKSVSKMGYATAWPGTLPTSGDLKVNQARAYVVAATVKKVEVKKQSDRMTEVACTVTIRVAPWLGTDGNELWEADRAASASGSAKAQTGVSEREIAGGVRDCVEAVAEEIATRQVIPFLQRLVGS
jgi:hypothetical protein